MSTLRGSYQRIWSAPGSAHIPLPELALYQVTYAPAFTASGCPTDLLASRQVRQERRTETIQALDADGAIAMFERQSDRMVTECKRVQTPEAQP